MGVRGLLGILLLLLCLGQELANLGKGQEQPSPKSEGMGQPELDFPIDAPLRMMLKDGQTIVFPQNTIGLPPSSKAANAGSRDTHTWDSTILLSLRDGSNDILEGMRIRDLP